MDQPAGKPVAGRGGLEGCEIAAGAACAGGADCGGIDDGTVAGGADCGGKKAIKIVLLRPISQ